MRSLPLRGVSALAALVTATALAACEPRARADASTPEARCAEWAKAHPGMPKAQEACVTAERAMARLEKLERWEGAGIGFAGTPGESWQELRKVLALGKDATAFLLRLASARSPVARVAAAVGLGELGAQAGPEGRAALERLAKDTTELDAMEGCVIHRATVAAYAKRALNPD